MTGSMTPSQTPSWRGRSLGLSTRLVLLTGLSCALVATILIVAFVRQTSTLMEDELRKHGQMVSIQLANGLAFETFSGDQVGLDRAVRTTMRDLPGTAYLVVRGASGAPLASAVNASLPGVGLEQLRPLEVHAGAERVVQRDDTLAGVEVISFATPILIEDRAAEPSEAIDPLMMGLDAPAPVEAGKERRTVGRVEVGFRVDELRTRIAAVTRTTVLLGALVLIGCLLVTVFATRLLTTPLERLARAATGIARGDLAQRLDFSGNDEIAEVARAFDTMAAGLRGMLTDLRSASTEVEREAAKILQTATQQSTMASQQATAISETSTTMSEIAQTSKQATSHADAVITLAQKSEDFTQDGQKVVEESISGMEMLGEQVKAIADSITDLSERTLQIGDIIATVKDLAEQSNLLALNASLEAAKAGEHGRGFAVVALEMRTLAEQSKSAATQIRGILGEVQKGTRGAVSATEEGRSRANAAVSLARSAGQSIVGLADAIRESSVAARQIAGNTRQQTIGVEQIVSAISDLSEAMTDTLEGTRQIEQVAANLSTLSRRLSELVGRYQL